MLVIWNFHFFCGGHRRSGSNGALLTLKDIPNYTDHSLSNVSHLPAVDQRIERWIKIHKCRRIIKQMQPQLGLTINLISCVNAYEGQKTNHKHHIHVKCSKQNFFSLAAFANSPFWFCPTGCNHAAGCESDLCGDVRLSISCSKLIPL